MIRKSMIAAFARPFAGMFALIAALVLSACGGGSGAPNNPFAPVPTPPPPLQVLPNPISVNAGTTSLLTISGGVPPYRAFSSNTNVLPVAATVVGNTLPLLANDVPESTTVTVTVKDAVNQTLDVTVTVFPAGGSAAPLALLPDIVTVSKGQTFVLTISGGAPPYKAFSSDPSVIPAPATVSGNTLTLTAGTSPLTIADYTVVITAQDATGQTATSFVNVHPDPAFGLPFQVLPSQTDAFSGVATTLTISGGRPPYSAFSSNSAILPVTANVSGNIVPLLPGSVGAPTLVTITATDANGRTATSSVTVNPAALVNNLTVTPNSADCGTQAICSGQTGTASVSVQAPGGGPAAGRQIRFDVVDGPFGIVPTGAPPGAATVPSLVVTSDIAGKAQVIIRANVDAPTQPAQIRATDIISGQQISGTFIIQQLTNGATILTVVPTSVTITGPFVGVCSSGFVIDYYVYGGTPPYGVTQTAPQATTLVNSTVTQSGRFFEIITNGTCVSPTTFSIVDATGRQITATLNNVQGTLPVPPVPPPSIPLLVTPSSVALIDCSGKTFSFVVTGGTPPYNAVQTNQLAIDLVGVPATITASSASFSVSGFPTASPTPARTYNISVVDSISASKTVAISCAAIP